METAVLVPIVVAVIGGIFVLLQRVIDRRYSRAKELMEKNSAEVENMTRVVQSFKELNDDYRLVLKEKDDRIHELEKLLAEKGDSV